MAFDLQTFIGGNIAEAVGKLISLFKVTPDVALANQTEVMRISAEAAAKAADAVTSEMQAAAEIIKAEATSQSALARNVRPLLLLVWGLTITVATIAPIVARFWIPDYPAVTLDPWVYKLTAIGFTGYVTARTWEKVTNSDK